MKFDAKMPQAQRRKPQPGHGIGISLADRLASEMQGLHLPIALAGGLHDEEAFARSDE